MEKLPDETADNTQNDPPQEEIIQLPNDYIPKQFRPAIDPLSDNSSNTQKSTENNITYIPQQTTLSSDIEPSDTTPPNQLKPKLQDNDVPPYTRNQTLYPKESEKNQSNTSDATQHESESKPESEPENNDDDYYYYQHLPTYDNTDYITAITKNESTQFTPINQTTNNELQLAEIILNNREQLSNFSEILEFESLRYPRSL